MTETYALFSRAEGHSQKSIDIVLYNLKIFARFLEEGKRGIGLEDAGPADIRLFIMHLKEASAFAQHRLTHPQDHGLSGHTINTYLRSLRAFYSWTVAEGFTSEHPFEGVKVPKAPHKVIATFSPEQITRLLSVINMDTPRGYRDAALIRLLLDSGLRIS